MCGSMADIQSAAAEIRRGKRRRRRRRRTNHSMKIYMVSLLHRATINQQQVLIFTDGSVVGDTDVGCGACFVVLLANVNSRSRSLYAIARPFVRPTQAVQVFNIYFYGIRHLGHPLKCTENFTEIAQGEPLRRGS